MKAISYIFTENNQNRINMYQPILLDANWNNGVFMIVIFAVVCVALVGILINFMMSGKKKDDLENPE